MVKIMSLAVREEVYLIFAQTSVQEIPLQIQLTFVISGNYLFFIQKYYGVIKKIMIVSFGMISNIRCVHFRCQNYLEEISNCYMEGYDVLPSAPQNFYFSNVGTTIGLLHWDEPALLGDSVTNYRVHYDESTVSIKSKTS